MLDNVDGLRERAQNGEIAFGTIDSWMVWNLTGGQVHITDYSNASRTLMYNIYDLDWDEELLEILEVPREVLPEVKPSSYVWRDRSGLLLRRVHPRRGDSRRPAGGPLRAGLLRTRAGQEHLRHGLLVLMNTGTEGVPSNEGLLTTIAWGSVTSRSSTPSKAPSS